jgi:5-methylcytosine-specific restriction protein B
MKNKKYWVVSPNVKNNGEVESWRKFLSKYPLVCMGWGPQDKGGHCFYHEMKINDVVIVAQRQSWKWNIYSLGIVSSDSFYGGNGIESSVWEEMPSASWYKKLSFWISKPKFETFNGYTGQIPPAIWQLTDEETIKCINTMIANEKKNVELSETLKMLKFNKNLILTGAPGTGKTYKTAEIAVALIDGSNKLPSNRSELMKRYKELIKTKQIVFTTFHQSLDYEEFVEGLKPDIADDGTGKGTFTVKSGIFKAICVAAQKNLENSQKTADVIFKENLVKELFENFLDESVSEKKEFDYDSTKQESGSNKFELIPHNDDNFFYADIKYNQSLKQQRIAKEDMLSVLLNENKISKPTDISKLFNTRFKYQYTFMFLILDTLRDKVKDIMDKKKNNDIEGKEKLKNIILIIDEINRGNISKIFGELITLLEKDKRIGEENEITVTLPYSQETFGVPSNFFIIGTMNTADRSIGHIDYAIRRRFAFLSLKSDRNVISSYDRYDNGVRAKAESLFDKIKDFIANNINSDLDADDLMIGHSYFLCKSADDLKMRLEFEIIPLIEEYEKDGIIMLDKSEMKTKFEEWKAL